MRTLLGPVPFLPVSLYRRICFVMHLLYLPIGQKKKKAHWLHLEVAPPRALVSLERPLPAASCREWLVLLSKPAAAISSTLMALCRCRAAARARRGRYTVCAACTVTRKRLGRTSTRGGSEERGRRMRCCWLRPRRRSTWRCCCRNSQDLAGPCCCRCSASTLVRADLAGCGVCRSKRALGSVSQATPRPWLPFGYSRARR